MAGFVPDADPLPSLAEVHSDPGLGQASTLPSAHCLRHKTRVQLTPIDTPVYVLHHWHRSHGHTAGGGIEGKDWPPTEGGKLFGLDPTLSGQIVPGEKGRCCGKRQ